MKFVEVVEGFSINIDSIVSVKDDKGTLVIQTEAREFEVQGDFHLFMDFIEHEEKQKREREKLTAQFFGG